MKITSNEVERNELVQYVVDCCMASETERRTLYERRRRFFLNGQNSDQKAKFNRLKSHMKLVSSFLFSPDGLVYNIAAPKNADDQSIQKFLALQDDFNEDIHDTGLGDVFAEAVLWGLNFDTMFIKMGWNDIKGHLFGKLVEPASMGFWNEADPDFDSQGAINHRYSLDYDDACVRLIKAGRSDKISSLQMTNSPPETGLGDTMSAIIISAVTGSGINETITGRADYDYEASPKFRAKITAPQITFDETWIWDNDAQDYRIFESLMGGNIVLTDSYRTIEAIKKASKEESKFNSQTNWYLEKSTPFVPITPYTLYNYVWGDAHMEDIIPLQEWSSERLGQIDEILQAQVDPLRTAHGMTGLTDEKVDLDYGGYIADDNPNSKVEEHRPPMPEDAFREFNEIGGLMMEASGLTEVVSGKSSGGARGGAQQKQMQITGGGQIRRVAVGLESPLVRMGDIALRLKMKNDDSHIKLPNGQEFIAAQCDDDFSLRVDGHSHSPLFTLESRELANMLFKAQAIDREWYIRMLNPTSRHNLLNSLKKRDEAEAKAKQEENQQEMLKHAKKP